MTKVKTKSTRQIAKNISLQVWYRNELAKAIKKMATKTEKEILKVWKQNTPKMTLKKEQAVFDSMQNVPSVQQDAVLSEIVCMQDAYSHAVRVKQKPRFLQATASVQQDAVLSEIVYDASPAASLAKVLTSLRHYFGTHFQTMADRVSKKFTKKALTGVNVNLKSILQEEGFTVDFRLTRQLNDILQATIAENVNLIKSIHGMYYDQVQTIVMQAVKNGRDMEYIKSELMERFRVTERKAQIIARDQTNKATQAISRARALETGITKAKWVHVPGAKTSREEHKAFNGQEFDLTKGLYDKKVGKYIMPGELINCNCRFKLVVPSVEKK